MRPLLLHVEFIFRCIEMLIFKRKKLILSSTLHSYHLKYGELFRCHFLDEVVRFHKGSMNLEQMSRPRRRCPGHRQGERGPSWELSLSRKGQGWSVCPHWQTAGGTDVSPGPVLREGGAERRAPGNKEIRVSFQRGRWRRSADHPRSSTPTALNS